MFKALTKVSIRTYNQFYIKYQYFLIFPYKKGGMAQNGYTSPPYFMDNNRIRDMFYLYE
jgi:hypothetical protein